MSSEKVQSKDDDDTLPSELYAALSDDSLDEEVVPSGDEIGSEDEEEMIEKVVEVEKPDPVLKERPMKLARAMPVQVEEAYLKHLKREAEKEEEGRKRGRCCRGISWWTTCFNLSVVLGTTLFYMYYTYGIIGMTPPDTFKPAYPLMITLTPYNTTSRRVSVGEIERESLGTASFSDRTPLYLVYRTLKWYAQNKGFVIVCAHHLQHDLGVHPQMCVLHNKLANQFYHMTNPTLKGFSKEKDVRVEESIACGSGKRTEKSRYKTIHVSYTDYPSKYSMQVEFESEASSTLQLVMEEMDGKYLCANIF